MKKNIIKLTIICLFVLIYSNIIFAQTSAWVKQSPIPTGNEIQVVYFTDSVTGYVAAGTEIYKTNDGGVNWDKLNLSPGYGNFTSISFTGSDTGYFAGANGRIYKTTNGGNSFDFKFSGISSEINQIYFPVNDTGYAVSDYGRVIKTVDGGNSWELLDIDTANNVETVYFTSAGTGFIGGFKFMKKTTDGGITWTTVTANFGGYFTIDRIQFVTKMNGFASNGSKILRTTNGGITWTQHQLDGTNSPVDFFFPETSTGFAITSSTRIYKTTDSGNSWTYVTTQFQSTPNSIYFSNNSVGFSVGDGGEIFKTTDAGVSWKPVSSGTYANIFSVFFLNSIKGFAVSNSGLLRTTNGGSFWERINLSNEWIQTVFFVSNIIGYTGGYTYGNSGYNFYRTSDGGESWNITSTLTNKPIYSIHFVNTDTGYIGSSYEVLKTTNSGLTWSIVYDGTSGTNHFFEKIFFLNNDTGFVLGQNGMIKTTNGGSTWTNVVLENNYSLNDISFYDNKTGFLSGTYLYKTTDSGNSWVKLTNSATYFSSIHILDSSTVFFTGSGVYKTINGGITINEICDFSTSLNDVYYTNNDTGYVVGNSGLIYKTVNGGCFVLPTIGPITGDTVICIGNLLSSYSVPNLTEFEQYFWDYSDSTTETHQYNNSFTIYPDDSSWSSGIITVSAINACGIMTQAFPLSVRIFPKPSTPVISIYSKDTLISSAPDGNQWYWNNMLIPGATEQKYSPSIDGMYSVVVTDSTGCRSNFSNILFTDVHLMQFPDYFTVKLTNDNIEISLVQSNDFKITLYDYCGKTIFTQSHKAKKIANINSENLINGVYLLQITTRAQTFTTKIFILR